MTVRGDEKRIVQFVELHTKWKCASFHWKTEVLISLKIQILKYFLDFLGI